ncbi:sodium-independent sulfate anion transporter-like [Bicyclus anynana]|uniref:Sodium-independent sulfate anion transporter-like n=1 Tax=Bicyclus anynana TaxID=110368 RepID=A0ABM3LF49_BICAN|nr:sodium-independent sulfate anion transporter-like [Bicyclus anynana]
MNVSTQDYAQFLCAHLFETRVMTTLDNTKQSGRLVRQKLKKSLRNACSVKSAKKRLPILEWLPKYSGAILVQDLIAGITVGLTAIPQGIAYAIIAGLSPEYGLYAGLMGGFVYLFVGSCKDITIGPTAIMAAMTSKYVSGYSADFAVLVAFLSGVLVLLMGIFNLGFLVEFISQPVISGFTTAAALQIAAAQLKGLFGLSGSGGNYFAESVVNFYHNFLTIKLWDTILGFTTVIILLLLKRLGDGCKRTDGFVKQTRWFISLGRNAVVVIIGIIVAYILKVVTDSEPLILIGDIGSGLPKFQLPPFTTQVGNDTYSFVDMANVLGPEAIIIPMVSILELIAIAKAFAGGAPINATQELIALGLCNIIGSFARSMPVTGSFTRTALNYASGVQTQAGGIFTGVLIILALSLLTSTFYYIPKASLAGLIMTAMFYMVDFMIIKRLWINSKKELFILLATIIICLLKGLEYGIVAGILIDAVILLYTTAKPTIEVNILRDEKGIMIVLILPESLPYCSADYTRRKILKASFEGELDTLMIIDGTNLRDMDTTVASNIITAVKDLDKKSRRIALLNFDSCLKKMCTDINSNVSDKFVNAGSADSLLEVSTRSA